MLKETMQRTGFIWRFLTQRKLDGLDLLEMQHVRLGILFLRWRWSSGRDERAVLLSSIKKNLLSLFQLKEMALYPTCEKFIELKRLVLRAEENQKLMKGLLKEIPDFSYPEDHSEIKIKVLMEEFNDQVREEENLLFPRIRAVMKRNQLDKLNREIRSVQQRRPGRVHRVAA